MNLLTQDLLAVCAPRLRPDMAERYRPCLEAAMTGAAIEAPYRAAAFLAQLAHESICLTVWEEIGGARRLKADGSPYYKGYWGRGPIQLTWRDTYAACGAALGLDLVGQPELLFRPDVGFRAAAWYWRSKGLSALADQIPARGMAAFDDISMRVHGCGRMASCACRAPRRAFYERAFAVMSTPRVIV